MANLCTAHLTLADLNEVVAGTWKVSTKTTSGAVVYTFVNKVTGMTLAVDPTLAKPRPTVFLVM